MVEGEEEYHVKKILDERTVRKRGRGGPQRLEYLVKWKGYAEPNWQPAENMEDTKALDTYVRQRP